MPSFKRNLLPKKKFSIIFLLRSIVHTTNTSKLIWSVWQFRIWHSSSVHWSFYIAVYKKGILFREACSSEELSARSLEHFSLCFFPASMQFFFQAHILLLYLYTANGAKNRPTHAFHILKHYIFATRRAHLIRTKDFLYRYCMCLFLPLKTHLVCIAAFFLEK